MQTILNFNNEELVAIWLSLKVAIYCTIISLPFALLIGYILARKQFWGKAILNSLLHLPLVMPPVTTGFLLLLVFGTNGFVGKWLFRIFEIKISFTFSAAIIAAIIVSFPLVVRSIRTAIEMVDPGLENASRILGAGTLKTIFKITLPLALPGILSGAILAFARSLGEFGATISFAGNIAGETQTLPLAIFAYMQVPGKEIETIRLVFVSIFISFLAMALSELLIKKMRKA